MFEKSHREGVVDKHVASTNVQRKIQTIQKIWKTLLARRRI